MGNFQAFSTENDQRVKFKGNEITELEDQSKSEEPTIEKYYKSILKAALTTFVPKANLAFVKEQVAENFEKKWKIVGKRNC